MNAWLAAAVLMLPIAARARQCALGPEQADAWCASSPGQPCENARRVLRDAAALDADIASCERTYCPADQAIALAGLMRRLQNEPLVQGWKDPPVPAVNDCLPIEETRLTALAHTEARRDLSKLPAADRVERLIGALEAKAPAARSREQLEAAGRAADGLWRAWSETSYAIDQVEELEKEDRAGPRGRLNALAARLAGFRDRLRALYLQAGLPVAPDAQEAARKLEGIHVPLELRLPTTLAQAPLPPSATPSVQPDVYGFASAGFSARVPAAEESSRLAETFTRTVGDPVGRGTLLHRQTGNRCAIVSQQQILQAYGLSPSSRPKAAELALSGRAWKLGQRSYLDKGTYFRFAGNLLQERGILTIKRPAATPKQLEAAARSGRLMTIDVDAGKLWSEHAYDGSGHTVLVTGARVDRAGRVLGYYVNDSGDDLGVPGRYVPAKDLLAAWKSRLVETR